MPIVNKILEVELGAWIVFQIGVIYEKCIRGYTLANVVHVLELRFVIQLYLQQLKEIISIRTFKIQNSRIRMISNPFKFLLSSLFFTLFLSVTPSGLLAQELRMTPTSANDIWPKTMGSVNYNEYWNYQMYFDNGMSLYIIFSVSDFGRLKSAVSGIRVSMYGLDENTYHITLVILLQNLGLIFSS